MGTDDQGHSRQQKEKLVRQKKLFGDKESKPCGKERHRHIIFMMRAVTVEQCIYPHAKCKADHSPFKKTVVNNIDTE